MGVIGLMGIALLFVLVIVLNLIANKNPLWLMVFFAFGILVGWVARGGK